MPCMPSTDSSGQREPERRAPVRLALGPDLAAQPLHRALHAGEPDAVARERGIGLRALEQPEQAWRVAHREASAVVAHEPCRTAPRQVAPAELDLRVRALAGELPR